MMFLGGVHHHHSSSNRLIGIATLMFYTCLWIPWLQIKRSLARILDTTIFRRRGGGHHQHHHHHQEEAMITILREEEEEEAAADDPPPVLMAAAHVRRFEDLLRMEVVEDDVEDEVPRRCSICLVQYERGSAVTQLQACAHAFHTECISNWVVRCPTEQHRCTCPLCRCPCTSAIN